MMVEARQPIVDSLRRQDFFCPDGTAGTSNRVGVGRKLPTPARETSAQCRVSVRRELLTPAKYEFPARPLAPPSGLFPS
ncbi:hypothetical protein D4R75_13700 [bacterium]|nr:MAG: hypothetical protein D4R75_13700 [bacterium]